MRTVQKIIKAFALCLAGLIIVTVVASMLGAVSLVGMLTGADEHTPGEMNTILRDKVARNEVLDLDVKIGATTLYMLESRDDEVRIETNNEHITSWRDGDVLRVVEESHIYLSSLFSDGDLTIYVPKGMRFRDARMEVGAGTLRIERLEVDELNLELGAGKTTIDYLKVRDRARIDGGAGVTELKKGELNNLRLELGAGKSEITAKLAGDNEIDSGVGKLDLNLVGEDSDYKLTIDKGLGVVTVNGEKQRDGAIYGQGENFVKIDSGVGAVDVKIIAE